MKDDINTFPEEFKTTVSDLKKEEDKLKEIQTKYQKLLNKMKSKYTKRSNIIKKIRKDKLDEINKEKEIAIEEISKLQELLNSILFNYCNRKGSHDYVLVSTKIANATKPLNNAVKFSYELLIRKKYRCIVCGRSYIDIVGLSELSYSNDKSHYIQKIPEEVYDDESLAIDGKTYRTIEEEKFKLEKYNDYLQFLKRKMCELFGHYNSEARMIDTNYSHKCECCGKLCTNEALLSQDYAKYKGVFDPYAIKYGLSVDGDLILDLPSYEEYLEITESKKDNNQDNSLILRNHIRKD